MNDAGMGCVQQKKGGRTYDQLIFTQDSHWGIAVGVCDSHEHTQVWRRSMVNCGEG